MFYPAGTRRLFPSRPPSTRPPTHTSASPLPIKEGGSTGLGRKAAPNCPRTHSTSETIPAAPPMPGNGVHKGATGADGRGPEAPAATSAAATSSSLIRPHRPPLGDVGRPRPRVDHQLAVAPGRHLRPGLHARSRRLRQDFLDAPLRRVVRHRAGVHRPSPSRPGGPRSWSPADFNAVPTGTVPTVAASHWQPRSAPRSVSPHTSRPESEGQ